MIESLKCEKCGQFERIIGLTICSWCQKTEREEVEEMANQQLKRLLSVPLYFLE